MNLVLSFAPFHRTIVAGTHVLPADHPLRMNVRFSTVKAAVVYMPTYLQRFRTIVRVFHEEELKRVFPSTKETQAIVDEHNGKRYGEYIIVPLLMITDKDVLGTLEAQLFLYVMYPILVQAVAKGLPVYMHRDAFARQLLPHLVHLGFRTLTDEKDDIIGLVLFPDNLSIDFYTRIERPLFIADTSDTNKFTTVEPLVDATGGLHRLVQLDRPGEFDIACRLLANAYREDPVLRVLFPDNLNRVDVLSSLMKLQCEEHAWRGLCMGTYATKHDGASVLNSCDTFSMTSAMIAAPPGAETSFLGAHLKRTVALWKQHRVPLKHYFEALKYGKMHLRNTQDRKNHLYLAWLCVADAFRGQGMGARLLRLNCRLCDVTKSFIYAEGSTHEQLIGLRKLDFRVGAVCELRRKDGEPVIGYSLYREWCHVDENAVPDREKEIEYENIAYENRRMITLS